MTYIGITIGPVVRTITAARKTRELWASSFVFSYFMKNLLLELKSYADILAPDISRLEGDEKLHGAGIWPDRCFLQIEDSAKVAVFKNSLPVCIENALKKIDEKLGEGQLNDLKKHFHCYACAFNTEGDRFEAQKDHKEEARYKETYLFRLNKILDDLELRPKFRAIKEYNLLEKLDDNIHTFYEEGYGEEDEALRHWQHGKTPQRRVRSLPELALQEFASTKDYYELVVLPIEEAIKAFRKSRGKEEKKAEEAIYQNLKSKLGDALKTRHRYVAIVHADGDNMGNTIASLKNDKGQIGAFSTELMQFSESAVKAIHGFGAMPVYAGGDDLLFIAPLQNDEGKTIYTLLKALHDDFSQRPLFEANKATLSFGLSLSYYKYPLGESVEKSLDLLKKGAKNFCISKDDKEKNALAIELQTHSGQPLKTLIWQGGKAYELWLELFNPAQNLEEAFLSGLMHKIDTLSLWLYDACRRQTLSAFFKAHFNEAIHGEKNGFIEKVQNLTKAIFEDYELEAAQNDDQKRLLGHQLYAMLRIVQFQNAADHE